MESSSSGSDLTPTIMPLSKTEEKIKAEHGCLHLNTPKSQAQSTLPGSFLAQCPPLLSTARKSVLNLAYFPSVLNDPFSTKALAYFQAAFAEYVIESTLSEFRSPDELPIQKPIYNNAPVLAKDYQTKYHSSEIGKNNNPPIIVPKKKIQYRLMNMPTLVMLRVRRGIKIYLKRKPEQEVRDNYFRYIENILDYASNQDKEKLATFLEGYTQKWKSWSRIQLFLQSDPRMGEILLNIIQGFFQEDGLEDFNDWLDGRMCNKSKTALIDMKQKLAQRFSKLLKPELIRKPKGDGKKKYLQLKEKCMRKEES